MHVVPIYTIWNTHNAHIRNTRLIQRTAYIYLYNIFICIYIYISICIYVYFIFYLCLCHDSHMNGTIRYITIYTLPLTICVWSFAYFYTAALYIFSSVLIALYAYYWFTSSLSFLFSLSLSLSPQCNSSRRNYKRWREHKVDGNRGTNNMNLIS